MKQPSCYFDYASATPLDESVFRVMVPYFSTCFYNPSSQYLASQKVKSDIEQARQLVAEVLGCKKNEIYFTAGGTEANNLIISGIMKHYPEAKCLISAIEHDSVRLAAEQYCHEVIGVDTEGFLNIKHLEQLLEDDSVVLVSVMYANNEIGTIQDIKKMSILLNKVRDRRRQNGVTLPIYLHTDACQAANYLSLFVHTLGVDAMTLNGGKIYGPKQSGALYIRSGISLQPVLFGGQQEKGLRSGTENVPAIIGFARALQIAQTKRPKESKRLHDLQNYCLDEITKLPGATINGPHKERLINNIHVSFKGVDNERLMMFCDEKGCMVATGSACHASDRRPSLVLQAIGKSKEEAESSIRISFGRETTMQAVDYLLSVLRDFLQLHNTTAA